MKYTLFFVLILGFAWLAFVPPEGMSKYPAVDVNIQIEEASGPSKAVMSSVAGTLTQFLPKKAVAE